MAHRIQHLWPVRTSGPELDSGCFEEHRLAALALLGSGERLTRKAGQFLGQLAVDATPMTAPQSKWLAKLLERSDLPPFIGEIAA